MSDFLTRPVTAFQSGRMLATGALGDVARIVKQAFDRDPTVQTLTFDDATGAQIDFDLAGTPAEFGERLAARAAYEAYLAEARLAAASPTGNPEVADEPGAGVAAARGPGRPRLGVVAREITLLPRHWEWLASQPGTASQVLRRLVDEARRQDGGRTRARQAREHAYAFITAVGGNLAGFEEASRALFAGDRPKFERETAAWPNDVRAYAVRLAFDAAAIQPSDAVAS
jgi:hypothetical protein